MEAGRGGWSEWVMPIPKGYLMKCCDCGLSHRLNFRLVPYGKGKVKIQFQAFRIERRTRRRSKS